MKPSDLQEMQSATIDPDLYDSSGPRENKVRKIIGAFPPGQKILDVGCANGAMLAPFAQQHDLHGVDISASMLSSAARAGFQTVQVDLEVNPLPYPDKTFDVLFCGENIEHYVNTDWVLSELNRVLKPGGRLVFTFPNIRHQSAWRCLSSLICRPCSPRVIAPHTFEILRCAWRSGL
jgi:methionine biosynthesis protein MetW